MPVQKTDSEGARDVTVITSHMGSDFDSLAAMVAASKLYPGAVLCMAGASGRTVRNFLAKNQRRWDILTPRRVRLRDIDFLVVVDARSLSRIGPFAEVASRDGVRVHVYDHHPPSCDDIDAEFACIEPVGATTTLMVEILLRKEIPISPQEATLFATGIYEDTGGMTFGGTGPRDFEAMAHLRTLGADMTSVPSSIEMTYTPPERKLLDTLIENARESFRGGVRVVLSHADLPSYIDGLSLFVHRLRDYFSADVVLAAARMGQRTYLVARSHEDTIDAARLLAPLGGGGHPQAASVTLHNADPKKLLSSMECVLDSEIPAKECVSNYMTSPVLAVAPDSSVNDAYRTMIRYGHAALPVVDARDLVGLITRKDLDKAHLHGYGLAQVREFMTEGVRTISGNASIQEAHRLFVIHNIGRLPVMEDDRLVGIITRTDLIRALYPYSVPKAEQREDAALPWKENVADSIEMVLSEHVQSLLWQIGAHAGKMGMRAFIVGGTVRDILLGRRGIDIDIVVEGDATLLVGAFGNECNCRTSVHERYKTGTILFDSGEKIDIATARREFYEFPSAQPTVSSDSLKHDLYRRDYTINAMAVSINPLSWGELLDYFGGRRDLSSRLLRVLHNLSFVEDPTRVLRGVRLEKRLSLNFEGNSMRLLTSCVRGGLLAKLSGFRLKSELEITLRESDPLPACRRMEDLGLWESIFPGICLKPGCFLRVRRLTVFLSRIPKGFPDFSGLEWLAFLTALLSESTEPVQRFAMDRLNLTRKERGIVVKSLVGLTQMEKELGGKIAPKNSRIVELLENVHPVPALYWSAATDRWHMRRRILLFLKNLRHRRPSLTGGDLIQIGYREGPWIGELLKFLRTLVLDNILVSREDEIRWVLGTYPTSTRSVRERVPVSQPVGDASQHPGRPLGDHLS